MSRPTKDAAAAPFVAEGLVAHTLPPMAVRIEPAHVEATIVHEFYITADAAEKYAGVDVKGRPMRSVNPPSTLADVTLCVMTLRNGTTLIGVSQPVDSNDYEADECRRMARQHAMEKARELMGYEARTRAAKRPSLQDIPPKEPPP